MKQRLDFVTNSSSSAFCIVGVAASNLGEYAVDFETLHDTCSQANLDVDTTGEGEPDYTYVGETIENMKDQDTLLEFKQQILKKLQATFPGVSVDIKDVEVHLDINYS